MASVRLKPKSRYWYACITLPDGKQKQFSTELEDKEKAYAAAVEAENAARRFHTKPHALRAAFTRIADEIIGTPAVDPAAFFAEWASLRAPEVTHGSGNTYKLVGKEAATWLADNGVTTLEAITASHVTRLRDHWAKGTSPVTANKKLKILRSALKYAMVMAKHIPTNPAEGVGSLKTTESARRAFTEKEIAILLPALSGEWRALFFFGLFTGQRINDLATLHWNQLDLANATMTSVAAKTGATIHLPLVTQITDCLAELPASDDPRSPVFPGLYAMSNPARSNTFREILEGVGLAPKRPNHNRKNDTLAKKRVTSELSFHSLRHTATTMLKAAGVADSIARAIIGHESKAVSRVYTHLDLETMRAALDKVAGAES